MAQPAVRPYQPVTPANNKYLAKRWDQEIFNTHRKKVAAAKAVIDNMPPRVHMHLHIKLKKLQFEAERLATIERDNRILLEKMAHIMRTGGLVDHKKLDYTCKSLNKTKRQRELLRISHENLAILKRLTTKDPHYNHKKWLMEWQVNQQYLMNISKYPHPWREEQSPYLSQIERQSAANKLISRRINTPTSSMRSTPVNTANSTKSSRVAQKLDLLAHLRPNVNSVEAKLDQEPETEVSCTMDTLEADCKRNAVRIDTGMWDDVQLKSAYDGAAFTGDCTWTQFNFDSSTDMQCGDEYFIKVTSADDLGDSAPDPEQVPDKTDGVSVKSLELTSVLSEELADYDE